MNEQKAVPESEQGKTRSAILPHKEVGRSESPPIIFVHGFGGDYLSFQPIQIALAAEFRSLAFDLPGHGNAVDWPVIGSPKQSADAVTQSLDALKIDKIHLVGHSMGGAIATIMAFSDPARIASLTLLAPGGFGTEINHRLLRRFATARTEAEIAPLLEQFFGWTFPIPPEVAGLIADARSNPKIIENLQVIMETLVDGDVQKTFPKDKFDTLGMPVKVLWGTQDRVLPTRQSHRFPGIVATHIFEEVGHMPHFEIPDQTIKLIRECARSGGK
ncbi:MAG: alpha/beta fold hydrolase [Stappiaceae bacterium]